MKIYKGAADMIGNTPLVYIEKFCEKYGINAKICLKNMLNSIFLPFISNTISVFYVLLQTVWLQAYSNGKKEYVRVDFT